MPGRGEAKDCPDLWPDVMENRLLLNLNGVSTCMQFNGETEQSF